MADTELFEHTPVLLRETLEALSPRDGGRYLDGTLGLGGHSSAILAAADCELCGIDRDKRALAIAAERLAPYGERARLFHARYSDFADCLGRLGWEQVDGVLLDIGVSSMQLDDDARGFSFNGDARLDMRMDRDFAGPSAWDLVNKWDVSRLRECIATLGEEPQAARIARAIVEARARTSIDTTAELAALVEKAYPASWRAKARRHPATRTFQALRMTVNDELGELERLLSGILSWLPCGGRLAVITFHSLEDRMVKQAMRHWAEGCRCPAHLPACVCHHQPEVRLLNKKPIRAEQGELAANHRASSAKLRAVEKIAEASQ